MKPQCKALLAAAAMTGLLAGATVRAAATPATPAKPATVTTASHGVRGLTGPTSKPAGNGTAGGQNTCGSVL